MMTEPCGLLNTGQEGGERTEENDIGSNGDNIRPAYQAV